MNSQTQSEAQSVMNQLEKSENGKEYRGAANHPPSGEGAAMSRRHVERWTGAAGITGTLIQLVGLLCRTARFDHWSRSRSGLPWLHRFRTRSGDCYPWLRLRGHGSRGHCQRDQSS